MFSLKDIVFELNKDKDNNELHGHQDLLMKYNDLDWEYYKSFSHKKYKKNLVYRNDNYEIFIICWSPGQFSPIHNHPENGCIFKIIEGEMSEYRYNINLDLIELNNLTKDSIGYIDKFGTHKMYNESNKTVVSLHIYSPPNFNAKIYKI